MPTDDKIKEREMWLKKEKARLMGEIGGSQKIDTFGGDTEDEAEQTDEVEELGNRLAIVQAKKNELAEIERALQKIAEGTYGICDNCGAKISQEILTIAPESALCEKCKKKG